MAASLAIAAIGAGVSAYNAWKQRQANEKAQQVKGLFFLSSINYSLGTCFPARHIFEHFGCEFVDRYSHCSELKAGDLLVDLGRQNVDAGGKLAFFFDEIFGRECLVGERHIHHGCRVAFGRGEVNQAAFA